MSLSSIGSRLSPSVQSLVDMRKQLDDLQRQLGTGQRSTTYAGLGLDSGLSVGLRSQLSSIGSFGDAITNVGMRLNLGQTALDRLVEVRQDVKGTALKTVTSGDDELGLSQRTAQSELAEIMGLLNTQAGDRYLFSGRDTNSPSVETMNHILNGDGVKAGLKHIIEERRQADVGSDGRGHLAFSAPTATSVRMSEDGTTAEFGFKIEGVTSSLTGATVTGPAGAPPAVTVDFTGTPAVGDTIQYRLTLPDGTTESVTLTATDQDPPGAGQFKIGATPADTAASFNGALDNSIKKLASTSLTAASAVEAGENFFADPPQRVDNTGPTPVLVDGTDADTVSWYTGEKSSDPARSAAVARIDTSVSVSYGVRANEDGIRSVVQGIATLAAVTFSASDPDASARSVALNQRIATALDTPPGQQTGENIQTDLAVSQQMLVAAKDRQTQTKSTLSGMVDQIEGIPYEEAAASILALNSRLQASLQTTALMLQTSLAKLI